MKIVPILVALALFISTIYVLNLPQSELNETNLAIS